MRDLPVIVTANQIRTDVNTIVVSAALFLSVKKHNICVSLVFNLNTTEGFN